MTDKLTHFDENGRPQMVDVSRKQESIRRAVARGYVSFTPDIYDMIKNGNSSKGDIRLVAELAGIIGAKRTSDLIPLCHPLPLSGVSVTVISDDHLNSFVVTAEVKTSGKTGVEMEALTAVSVACLTIYDMAKSLDKAILIEKIELQEKSGGKSGDYHRAAEAS
ncbi:cyclic pyranopterin monophosphate synthase MoaC [Parvularcula sp. IMCC14364]|uniref:cyclic pyranopterin monophosphate synthase MoaC n=1 Tax=Parvularcula sp. IMCC14364 TaxID=3067902 RepID=UPI0027405CCC|nr:cyclic pyranopterin monophosphate synthase MoaC [Parvularcula sp. IMCC14364]